MISDLEVTGLDVSVAVSDIIDELSGVGSSDVVHVDRSEGFDRRQA